MSTRDLTMVVGRDLREVSATVRLTHWSSTDWLVEVLSARDTETGEPVRVDDNLEAAAESAYVETAWDRSW